MGRPQRLEHRLIIAESRGRAMVRLSIKATIMAMGKIS